MNSGTISLKIPGNCPFLRNHCFPMLCGFTLCMCRLVFSEDSKASYTDFWSSTLCGFLPFRYIAFQILACMGFPKLWSLSPQVSENLTFWLGSPFLCRCLGINLLAENWKFLELYWVHLICFSFLTCYNSTFFNVQKWWFYKFCHLSILHYVRGR